jgi:hypothetical protein
MTVCQILYDKPRVGASPIPFRVRDCSRAVERYFVFRPDKRRPLYSTSWCNNA